MFYSINNPLVIIAHGECFDVARGIRGRAIRNKFGAVERLVGEFDQERNLGGVLWRAGIHELRSELGPQMREKHTV